jgi:hypothetical protein
VADRHVHQDGGVTVVEQHSVHADRHVRHPSYIADLARQAASDIDEGQASGDADRVIAGCRRLIAVGGLAKAVADTLEAGQ